MHTLPVTEHSRGNAPAVTSLDPQETNDVLPAHCFHEPDPRRSETSITFRHRMYTWHRTKVVRSFERIMVHESRIFSYMGCGSGGWVVQSRTEPDRFALRSDTCHDRWCPACSKSRSMTLRANLDPLLKHKAVRFVTLTLRSREESLGVMLDRLNDSFVTLRKLKLWRDAVDAGVAFTEVKIGKDSRQWHAHLHVLIIGRYLPQEQLKQAWLAITGDSHIVDVRVVKDDAKVAQYVTKYCTKPGDNDLYRDENALDEAIIALKGRRLVTTIGAWRGVRLLRNDTISDWEPVMPWPELLRRCRDCDPIAVDIYKLITRNEWIADDTDIDDTRAPPF